MCFSFDQLAKYIKCVGFRTAKRLDARFTFYATIIIHVGLIYLKHYPSMSLPQYSLFAKTNWKKDKLPVTSNFSYHIVSSVLKNAISWN